LGTSARPVRQPQGSNIGFKTAYRGRAVCIGVWARHQKREVEAPKAPSKLIWTITRVADRLGAFIAASRGKVGDVLRSVIYFWEPSLRAQ